MWQVEVEVKGPGRCFWYEMQLIQDALESAGINVKVIDEEEDRYIAVCGPRDMVQRAEAMELEKQRRLSANENEFGKTVVLKAKHMPWGG